VDCLAAKPAQALPTLPDADRTGDFHFKKRLRSVRLGGISNMLDRRLRFPALLVSRCSNTRHGTLSETDHRSLQRASIRLSFRDFASWRRILRLALTAVGCVIAWGGMPLMTDGAEVNFSRGIRPLLSDRCYRCHGPDEKERQAGLRLDQRDAAFAPRDGGAAIVAGKAAESVIWQRITSTDPTLRMPPPESGKTLSETEIDQIRRWIDEGAPWQDHWSFASPTRPQVPAVRHAERVFNPIDAFILARVEQAGLSPAAEADRETLIRRATFDLTGLPPTLEEVDAFLGDSEPGAYERVVDRLLKSPRYGEHMARYWLDLARYGDTHGLHLDNRRQIWPYRDWLIRAFNENLPFDQFTVWQLAGDLLPQPTTDQLVATGFNRCNVTTSEGGSIAEEYRVRYAVDRVETTATVWMGLTAGCAVCHDHKFDPLTQNEFYRLYGYFYNFAESEMDGNALLPNGPTLAAPSPTQREQLTGLEKKSTELDTALAARREAVTDALAAWEAKVRSGEEKLPAAPSDMLVYLPLDETEGMSAANRVGESSPATLVGKPNWVAGQHAGALQLSGDAHLELLGVGDLERTDAFSYGAWVKPDNEKAGTIISRMIDGQAFRGYDLYLGNGQVFVHLIHSWEGNAIRVNTKEKLKVNTWQHVMMTYDGSSKAAGVRIFVDGKPMELQITHDTLTETIKADTPLRVGRRNPGAALEGVLDEVRIYARRLSAEEVALVAGGNPVAELLAIDPANRNDAQRTQIRDYYLAQYDAPYQQLRQQQASLVQERTALESSIPKTMIMGDRSNRAPIYRLVRGQYDHPDTSQALEPNVPAVLPALPADKTGTRLDLARWLVDPRHPLTARVTVNRFWQQLFGMGIVKTTEDFGSQGEWPSHPELLDWLAVEFVESGWDVKGLFKKLMMSHTYRQQAIATADQLTQDRDNRLLSRGPRFRLDAETIRDNALALSGLLVGEIGGPSVRPYQPSGLWEAVGYTSSNTARFEQDHGIALYRRSMYTFWKRTAPPPSMQIFDAPSREYCVTRRERTNTPTAALVMLNDQQFVEASRQFAQRLLKETKAEPTERLRIAFRMATARFPSERELQILTRVQQRAFETYRANPQAAEALLAIGESPRDKTLDPVEHAAWTILASTILNLDETLTKG
jgi:hypothetical protein